MRRDRHRVLDWKPVDKTAGKAPESRVQPAEPPVAVLEPGEPELVLEPAAAPGAALAPIPLLYPMGGPGAATEFWYLYNLISGVNDTVQALGGGGGGGGTIVLTNTTNNFTTNQSITVTDLFNAELVLAIDIENAAPGVSYPLTLTHRYQPGVGPTGLGVGINLLAETDQEGTVQTVATFEGQTITNAHGGVDGSAGINVTIAGDSERVVTVFKDHTEIRHHITDPAPGGDMVYTFWSARSPGSGQRSLILDRPASDFNPHGIEWSMGGTRFWGLGMDADAVDATTTDMILLYSYMVQPNGRDIFRFSHRAAGSGGVKAIFGANGIGSPVNQNATFVIEADASVGVMELRENNGSFPHVKLVQQNGSQRALIDHAGRFQVGSDFAGGNSGSYCIRDLAANAHRVFIDSSGNLALGGSSAPVSTLSVLKAPTASANFGLVSAGDGGFTGAAGHFAGSASGTGIAANHASGYLGNLIDLQVNGATKFRVGPDGTIYKNGVAIGGGGDALVGSSNAWSAAQTFTLDDATTNASSYPVRLRHTTSGTAAVGMGVGLQFEAENGGGGVSTLANLFVQEDNPNSVNLTTSYQFQVMRNSFQRTMLQVNADDVRLPQSPIATANYGLLSLGGGGFLGGSGTFQGSSSGTFIAGNIDPGFTGNWIDLQEDGKVRLQVLGNGQIVNNVWDANSSSVTPGLQIEHRLTAGAAAVGYGTSLELRGRDSAGAGNYLAGIEAICQDVTPSALAVDVVIRRSDGLGITEVARWDYTGQFTLPQKFAHTGTAIGFFNKAPAAQQVGGALSAGATYGATERSMLNALWSMSQAYGLLT